MPERNIAMIYCSFGLGLRAKEIAALKISDIFDGQLNVLEEVNLTRSMTKGEKQRHIYINNKKIIKALKEFITWQKNTTLSSMVKTGCTKPSANKGSVQMFCKNGFANFTIKQASKVRVPILGAEHSLPV